MLTVMYIFLGIIGFLGVVVVWLVFYFLKQSNRSDHEDSVSGGERLDVQEEKRSHP